MNECVGIWCAWCVCAYRFVIIFSANRSAGWEGFKNNMHVVGVRRACKQTMLFKCAPVNRRPTKMCAHAYACFTVLWLPQRDYHAWHQQQVTRTRIIIKGKHTHASNHLRTSCLQLVSEPPLSARRVYGAVEMFTLWRSKDQSRRRRRLAFVRVLSWL